MQGSLCDGPHQSQSDDKTGEVGQAEVSLTLVVLSHAGAVARGKLQNPMLHN
jgi:hypothetical protein